MFLIKKALIVFFTLFLVVNGYAKEGHKPNFWSRVYTSFLFFDEHHAGGKTNFAGLGRNSLATYLHNGAPAAEVDMQTYSIEGAFSFLDGWHIYGSLNWSNIHVDASPESMLTYDEGQKFREWKLGFGYSWTASDFLFQADLQYLFNEDDSFAARGVVIPTTDGSDSLIFKFKSQFQKWNLNHRILIQVQDFQKADSSPFPGAFELGERLKVGYDIGKWFDQLYVAIGNHFYTSKQTKGNYLYEKPRWNDLVFTLTYRTEEDWLIDLSYQYVYEGSDYPKVSQINIGLSSIF